MYLIDAFSDETDGLSTLSFKSNATWPAIAVRTDNHPILDNVNFVPPAGIRLHIKFSDHAFWHRSICVRFTFLHFCHEAQTN